MNPYLPSTQPGGDLSSVVVRVPPFASPQSAPPPSAPAQTAPHQDAPALDDRQAEELAIRLLGENLCRRLGIYRVPKGFVLSVVIPVYNEIHTVGLKFEQKLKDYLI